MPKNSCVSVMASLKLKSVPPNIFCRLCQKKFMWHWWLAGPNICQFPIFWCRAPPPTYCTSKTPSSHFITFQRSTGGSQAIVTESNFFLFLWKTNMPKILVKKHSVLVNMRDSSPPCTHSSPIVSICLDPFKLSSSPKTSKNSVF